MANYGLSVNDIPQAFKVSTIYEVPFGKGKALLNSNPVADVVLGGWQLSGIMIRQSGTVFTPVMGTANNSGSLAGSWYPNRIGSGVLDNPTNARWFDTAAFTTPAQYTFGNSGRDILRGPKWFTLDASMGKSFNFARLHEGMRLNFRMDATNILNHAVFGLPNSNIGASGVATVTSTVVGRRTLQLGARLSF